MKPFVVNTHGHMVFPSNFFPEPDFSTIETVAELGAIIRRDFEVKTPLDAEIAARAISGNYANRYELLRDLGLYLFWMNRSAMAMYEKRPTRWRDVARSREDLFLPALTPWVNPEQKIADVEDGYRRLPPAWSPEVEDDLFAELFDLFRHKRHQASAMPPIEPTVAEALAEGSQLTKTLASYDPDYPRFGLDEIIDCHEEAPELEALRRWAMTLHNQFPWDRSEARLTPVSELTDDDIVVVFHPRSHGVMDFIRRVKLGATLRPHTPAAQPSRQPISPLPPVQVRTQFDVQPRIEALAV